MTANIYTTGHQAIETRYVGPSNVRGARVIAKCDARRIIVEWDHALSSAENHMEAARELCRRLDWHGKLLMGGIGAKYVFVFAAGD